MNEKNRKLAIVTGGGTGIGLAIAQSFITAGYKTIIIGRDPEKLAKAQSDLGPNSAIYSHDLNELGSLPLLIQNIVEAHGQIDVLVNNAGINMKKDLIEVTDDDFLKVVQTNLLAVFSLSREVIKYMLTEGHGNIINISSMAAQYGLPRVVAYSASKTAIEGMTRAMASELSSKGIRINCIAPGFIITPMTDRAFQSDPARKEKALGRTPMGIMGMPADIGDAAVFLASEHAKFITGVVLPVDGGNSIGF